MTSDKLKYPWMQFWVDDWINDPAVSLCAPATRGVWMDLLCAMHKSGLSGELRGTPDQLARLARCSTAELAQALTDLQASDAADVTERNGVVTVVNRRMYRAAQSLLKTRESTKLRVRRHREKRRCNSDVTQQKLDTKKLDTRNAASAANTTSNADPPSIEQQQRQELIALAGTAGVDQARSAVLAAFAAGCTAAEIDAAIAEYLKRDVPPGWLHTKLTSMLPGQPAAQGFPPLITEPTPAEKRRQAKADADRRQAEADERQRAAERKAAERRERDFGPSFDAMADDELADLMGPTNPLLPILQRQGRTPMVREWALSQLEKLRAVQ